MKIGFFNEHGKNNIGKDTNAKTQFIIGDEVLALTLIKSLKEIDETIEGAVYSPDCPPTEKLDIMVYMAMINAKPNPDWAHKHVLYLQIGLPSYILENQMKEHLYDGYICYSQDLIEKYRHIWGDALYLPFCVDSNDYYPAEYDKNYDYDVTYVGGSWKDDDRIEKYLYPAAKFHLGLFGSWKIQRKDYKCEFNLKIFLKHLFRFNINPARREFKKFKIYQIITELTNLCKGLLPQEKAAALYSSSKIVLNFGTSKIVEDNTITLRTYEVLACKGFLISDRTPIAEELLKDCVVFTDGGKDLERKIKYYLKNPEERKQIAENGYKWVMKNATKEMIAKILYEYLTKNILERIEI